MIEPEIEEKALRSYLTDTARNSYEKNNLKADTMRLRKVLMETAVRPSGRLPGIKNAEYFKKRFGGAEMIKYMSHTLYPNTYEANLIKSKEPVETEHSKKIHQFFEEVSRNCYKLPRSQQSYQLAAKLGGVEKVIGYSKSLFPREKLSLEWSELTCRERRKLSTDELKRLFPDYNNSSIIIDMDSNKSIGSDL